MIISASRRTDIPAFYTQWFMNRIESGFCTVPNPFNSNQVAYVSLKPEDVEVIVFWTRYPRPLFPYLKDLESLGYRYYFQYTLLNYPRLLDVKNPSFKKSVGTFRQLADSVGPQKVIWRYDPILFSSVTDKEFHLGNFRQLAQALQGYTRRCVISLADIDQYRKVSTRLSGLKSKGLSLVPLETANLSDLIGHLVQEAHDHGMEIFSCAEEVDLKPYGVRPGKCVDDELIAKLFPELKERIPGKKDPHQRKPCGCVVSKDIGMFNTCLFDCQYCYATVSYKAAANNHGQRHDPRAPSLLDHYEVEFQPLSAAKAQGSFNFGE